MLKEILVSAAAVAAGLVPFTGIASADANGYPHGDDSDEQIGLLNVHNLDVLHNVNASVGVCDNNINVLGIQVPIRDTLNGIGIPILSPGESEAVSATPYNCSSAELEDGGTYQGD